MSDQPRPSLATRTVGDPTLSSSDLLDAAREIERQNLADAVAAFDLADLAAKHQQIEIEKGVRPRSLDQLPDDQRKLLIADAKIGLRLSRPLWRRLVRARIEQGMLSGLQTFASQFIPAARMPALAHRLTAGLFESGLHVLDNTRPPTPREFATAHQAARRAGESR